MLQQPSAVIQSVRYTPAYSYPLDLEVFSASELRRRVNEEHLRSTQRIDFHMLICITNGRLTHTVDFERMTCESGSLLALRPMQVQQFDVTANWEGWLVIFRPEFLLPLQKTVLVGDLNAYGGLEALPTHLPLNEAASRAVTDAIVQMHDDTLMRAAPTDIHSLLRHQLYALLLRLHLGHRRQEAQGNTSIASLQRFKQFQQLLEKNFSIHHQVATYATQLGCSEKSLARATLDVAGVGAKAYIAARVNLEAKRLLVQTTLPIARIAEQVGFDEATNFVKFFKREVGCAPREFRRRHAQ
jgi:AraC-like DNA-binding protein